MTLTLGTAQITSQNNQTIVEYMNSGSFLRGEQRFANEQQAREFCQSRKLRVIG